VRWFPLDTGAGDQKPSGDVVEGSTSVMPLFPLGAAYLPHTVGQHGLISTLISPPLRICPVEHDPSWPEA